jgi:hypothetical protein
MLQNHQARVVHRRGSGGRRRRRKGTTRLVLLIMAIAAYLDEEARATRSAIQQDTVACTHITRRCDTYFAQRQCVGFVYDSRRGTHLTYVACVFICGHGGRGGRGLCTRVSFSPRPGPCRLCERKGKKKKTRLSLELLWQEGGECNGGLRHSQKGKAMYHPFILTFFPPL